MKNLLREYLLNSKMSRLKFANKLGVDPSIVYKWLKYETIPTAKHAKKMEVLSKGRVPINYWGYVETVDGKIIRLGRKPLRFEKLSYEDVVEDSLLLNPTSSKPLADLFKDAILPENASVRSDAL